MRQVDYYEITEHNVTLDLNGFTISGPPGGACPLSGCQDGHGINGTVQDNVTVMDGTVRDMVGTGVRLRVNARVERVQALNNGGDGIVAGGSSTVSGNIADDNGGDGIVAGVNSTVSGNIATDNGDDGIDAAGDSITVSGNTADGNGDDGIAASGTVSDNTANNNGDDGIRGAGTVSGNRASGNGDDGIAVSTGLVSGNHATGNGGFGLNCLSFTGYSNNVFSNNNGVGFDDPQVSGVCTEIGTNLCVSGTPGCP